MFPTQVKMPLPRPNPQPNTPLTAALYGPIMDMPGCSFLNWPNQVRKHQAIPKWGNSASQTMVLQPLRQRLEIGSTLS